MECFFRSPPYGRLSGTQRDKEKETLRRKRVDTNCWGIGGGYLLVVWLEEFCISCMYCKKHNYKCRTASSMIPSNSSTREFHVSF